MKKILWAGCLALVLLVGVHTVLAGETLSVKSTLSGEVTWAAEPGTEVTEGSELVRVATLTGEVAAARAPQAGTVQEVFVKPGDQITAGTIAARLRINK